MSGPALGPDVADDIVDALFDDSDPTNLQQANLYLTVFDDSDSELEAEFADARLETSPSDWTKTNSAYENDTSLNLGEAGSDVENVEDVALFDSSSDGTLLIRTDIDDGPINVSDGTELIFETGDLSFDALEYTD